MEIKAPEFMKKEKKKPHVDVSKSKWGEFRLFYDGYFLTVLFWICHFEVCRVVEPLERIPANQCS